MDNLIQPYTFPQAALIPPAVRIELPERTRDILQEFGDGIRDILMGISEGLQRFGRWLWKLFGGPAVRPRHSKQTRAYLAVKASEAHRRNRRVRYARG